MAFRANTTGFSGTTVPGSGIEYAPGNSSPGTLADRLVIAPLTVFFSFKVNSTANAGNGSPWSIWYMFSSGGDAGSLVIQWYRTSNYVQLYWSNHPGPGLGMNYNYSDGTTAVFEVGQWYDICFSIDNPTGEGGTGMVFGAFGRSGHNEWHVTQGGNTPHSSLNRLSTYSTWLGATGFDSWVDMSWDNVKLWTKAVSMEELRNERTKRLKRTADIHSWLPCIDTSNNSALINMAGNGKNWSNWINTGFQAPYMTTDSSPNGWGASPYTILEFPRLVYSFGYILG